MSSSNNVTEGSRLLQDIADEESFSTNKENNTKPYGLIALFIFIVVVILLVSYVPQRLCMYN
ncbi:2791_t:CDS:2 [Entrophospora sp. SA101]|nr:2791_t:CDS:2 [Entrophospora sp. SA101]